ncbi:MAG TPA: Cof-type HAD-IIB family hydrolase [Acidimicrobiales bacterium]
MGRECAARHRRAYHRPIVTDHAAPKGPARPPIRLFLADVDGTLVTKDKVLTDDAVAAVRSLREAGVLFALTSGRPPKGMEMLVAPLGIGTPIAAFNGGLMVDRNLQVLEQRVIPEDLVTPVVDHLKSFDLDVWLYRGADWYVPDPKAPHVDREAWTVKFKPKVRKSFDGLTDGVAKLVGVSDDHDAIDKAVEAAVEKFGDQVTAAASQPYYLDVTSPQANKGEVARYLARSFALEPEEIATIGDQPNDILMFDHSGLSIAMANADPEAKKAAHEVTRSNEDEGFAYAVEHFVLPAAQTS